MTFRPVALLALSLLAASPWLPERRSAAAAAGAGSESGWLVPRGTLVLEGMPAPILVENATIFTSAGPRIERGWVLLENRLVAGVGAGDYAGELPAGVLRVDATGRYVTPGLIDVHTHMGVYASPGAPAHSDGNEMVGPLTAGVEAIHAFWPQDPAIERAVAGGVTTVQVLPGSANLVGGRGATLKLHPRLTPQEMRFPGAKDGLKMACGENPKRVYGGRGGPATRMGNIYRDRKAWVEATEYARRWRRWEEGSQSGPPPARDLAKEAMAGVLSGDLLAHIHCYRADDILHMLALAEEFGWKVR
ncbi:amidohydrolase, partial [bacterium]|nr:amidohydrolase [bacterium]